MFNFKVSKAIRELDEYQKIVDGFKAHKNGDTPAFLGRDVGYDHPDTPRLVREYLTHIHLCLPTDAHNYQTWMPYLKSIADQAQRIDLGSRAKV